MHKVLFILFSLLAVFHPAVGNAVELDFFIPGGATAETSRMYLGFVKDFNKENPGNKINLKPSNSYEEVLKLAIDPNNRGIFVTEISELLTQKDAGVIMQLEELIQEEPGGKNAFLKQFIHGFLGNSRGDDGKYYGLPIFRSTPIIFYNLDLLQKAGIDTNNLPKTWDELESVLKTVKEKLGIPGLGLGGVWYDWIFEAFVRQNGGSLSNETNTEVFFNAPETVEALNFLKKLKDNDLLTRVHDWKATINGFTSLQLYPVVYYSTGGMETVKNNAKFKWTTTMMPKNKVFGTPTGGANITISSNLKSEEVAVAWKFIKFLLKEDAQATICSNSGYFPVVTAAFDHPLIKDRYTQEDSLKQARAQLDFAAPKIMTRNNNKVRDILKSAIDETLDKGIPSDQSLQKAQAEAEKIIKKQ